MLAKLPHRAPLGRDKRGFTLIEVTIILLVLVTLGMIILPQLGNFNLMARKVKVKEDLGALCASFKVFLDQVQLSGPYLYPGGGFEQPRDPVGLLVGPGEPPHDTGRVIHTDVHTPFPWNSAPSAHTGLGYQLAVATDVSRTVVNFAVDRLENHLQLNGPYSRTLVGDSTARYVNTLENPGMAGDFFGWRGPYFDLITPDPWGTRYAINTFALHKPHNAYVVPATSLTNKGHGGRRGDIFSTAVVCYSAGADRYAHTAFNQPMNVWPFGWTTGGDDIAVVLSSMGPI